VVSGAAKRALFDAADVFVLPSYSEGFSLAILEAMFHGLPVITSRAGGSPDVVRDGDNGLVVEPGDVDGLGRAIERLLGDPTLRERIGRRNAREARERYDLGVVARRLAGILDDAARGGQARPA
jgi:glycosyltransferase involved in cell wall biosynthesis